MLLDSNVIIYAARPEHSALRDFIEVHAPGVSIISQIEVLGYHKLNDTDRQFLERFFQTTERFPLSETVVQMAIELRRRRRMSLGDSIIAATAIVHKRTLATRDIDDFRWLEELKLHDPLAAPG